MFIESLGEDLPTLRVCSLVSSVFHDFCSPLLYRGIVLDCREKLNTFLQIGECSDSLRHTKSFGLSLAYDGHLHDRILEIISRKASLETLCLRRVRFYATLLTAPLSSKLSDVTALILRECHFEKFEDFVTFIRCFPRCKTLRLHGCNWDQNGYSYTDPNTSGKVSADGPVRDPSCY